MKNINEQFENAEFNEIVDEQVLAKAIGIGIILISIVLLALFGVIYLAYSIWQN